MKIQQLCQEEKKKNIVNETPNEQCATLVMCNQH